MGDEDIKLWLGLPFLMLLLSYSLLFFFGGELRWQLLREDGLLENVSALFWLLSAIFFFVLFLLDQRGNDFFFIKSNRNIFFLMLGVVFFIGFGEEISWGQRFFGLKTPPVLCELNEQRELNIHNLKGFTVERLFSVFWFFYCVVAPVVSKLSKKSHVFFKRINLPLVPVGGGLLFLFNYFVSKSLQPYFTGHCENMPIEIKECNSAFLFMIIGFVFLMAQSRSVSKKTA